MPIRILLVDNGLYEVTGGQAVANARSTNFASLARAAGIGRVYECNNRSEWDAVAGESLSGEGPVFVWLKVEGELGKPTPTAPRPMAEQIQAYITLSRVTGILTAAFAAVATLLAAIGLYGVLAYAVLQRTKEIGVRKSIGARSKDILRQFLAEAVFISEAGGVLGIILGIIVGDLLAAWLKVDLIFPYGWAIAGLVVCSAIGIGFGLYPAYRAASLDPIEALRYE